MMMRVCAIVPAFNEAPRVGAVVRPLLSCPLVDSVLVVDDGSSDGTAEAAEAAGARVLRLECNCGKGGAVAAGLAQTEGEIVLILDADLVGLESEHIEALVRPVLNDEADMTLGVFGGGRLATDLAQAVTPWLTGQRAVLRKVLDGLDVSITRFGVETALTRHAQRAGLRVMAVRLDHLTHVMKEEKMGAAEGIKSRFRMYWDIIRNLVTRD